MITQFMYDEFHENGFLILPGFFHDSIVEYIKREIYDIIGHIIARSGLNDRRQPFEGDKFDEYYREIISFDRSLGGLIYDAVKQIPAFVRLCADPKLEDLFLGLRLNSQPGLAAGGYGIRIDNPQEEKFRAPWHQEYPAQLRSLNGLVYWSPLVPVTEELGPVKIAVGSHKLGPLPVFKDDPENPEKSGAYALTIGGIDDIVKRHQVVAPLTQPGDLLIMDFLLLHASGQNVSRRSRWSMQLRYFDFAEQTGIRHGWQKSFAGGGDFATVHPELVLKRLKSDRLC